MAVPVAAAAADAAGSGPADACSALIPDPWPATLIERRLHLRRLEAARQQCISSAPFLAALGALLLEEGNAEEARIWLERALMLEPDNDGTLADHALALAALGEPTAVRELARAWRGRSDVPAALRQRITAVVDPGGELRLPAAPLGLAPAGDRMATRGDASVLIGYDNNLAVSPRLTELQLTPPEGPVVLPVISTPRRGAAARIDVSWQAAWELSQRRVLRTGLGASARSAPGNSSTDWHQLTAAAGLTQRWGDWRAVAQVDGAWFGGALTEPYTLARARIGLELATERCNHSVHLEGDERRQSRTRTADARAAHASLRLQCRPFGTAALQAGVHLRGGVDRPRDPERPGGVQRSESAVLRFEYRPSALSLIDLSIGSTRLTDESGYSTLLDNNAIRTQRQDFISVELSRALDLNWMPGAEAVLQVTRFRQRSNLSLFQHQGANGYLGLRWPW